MDFQLISSTLGSLSNDWDLRVAALKQIQKSVDADSDLTPAELYEGIQIIAKPLAVQVTGKISKKKRKKGKGQARPCAAKSGSPFIRIDQKAQLAVTLSVQNSN